METTRDIHGQDDRTVAAPPPTIAGAEGLSVILPALNVEALIGETVATLRRELQPVVEPLEFIVVDDGGSDDTAGVVHRLSGSAADVRLLRNHRNLGKGMSVYLGLLAAHYSTVCFTDADLPFVPGSYARVVRRLRQGQPFVVASRRMRDSETLVRMEVLRYAAWRHLVGLVFNRLVRLGLGLSLRDAQCGLKGFDRRVGLELFRRVRSSRFLFDIELFLAARCAGVPVEEVPVGIVYNDARSSMKLAAESSRMLLGLAMICVRHGPRRYRFPNPSMAPETVRGWAEEIR